MHFRLYLLGGDGRIMRGIDLDCLDEAEARAITRDYVHAYGRELWQGDRQVMRCETAAPAIAIAPERPSVHFLARCTAVYVNGIGGLDG